MTERRRSLHHGLIFGEEFHKCYGVSVSSVFRQAVTNRVFSCPYAPHDFEILENLLDRCAAMLDGKELSNDFLERVTGLKWSDGTSVLESFFKDAEVGAKRPTLAFFPETKYEKAKEGDWSGFPQLVPAGAPQTLAEAPPSAPPIQSPPIQSTVRSSELVGAQDLPDDLGGGPPKPELDPTRLDLTQASNTAIPSTHDSIPQGADPATATKLGQDAHAAPLLHNILSSNLNDAEPVQLDGLPLAYSFVGDQAMSITTANEIAKMFASISQPSGGSFRITNGDKIDTKEWFETHARPFFRRVNDGGERALNLPRRAPGLAVALIRAVCAQLGPIKEYIYEAKSVKLCLGTPTYSSIARILFSC
eukprot:TRINITY_DN1138_c0_g2_i1.p1 TRINITY_DN1138_c0_g2~~TRINITY_DN1138_c0_g2_i1.p1  ORF type:complete len:362 (+),score=47.18 TRINITY_DN1138_c0_g2_i1:944-2029(+)